MSNVIFLACSLVLLSFGCVARRTAPEPKANSTQYPAGGSSFSTPSHEIHSQEQPNSTKEVNLKSFEYDFGIYYENISVTCNDNEILMSINGTNEGSIVALLKQNDNLSTWKRKNITHYKKNIYWDKHEGLCLNSYDTVISADDVNVRIIPKESWILGGRSYLGKACFVVDLEKQYRVLYITSDGRIKNAVIDLDKFLVDTQLEFVDIPDFSPMLKISDRRYKNFAYNGTKVLFTDRGYLLYNWPRDLLIAIDNNTNSITYLCGSLQEAISLNYPGFRIHQMCVCCVDESIIVATEKKNAESINESILLHMFSITYDYENNILHMNKRIGSVSIHPKSYYPDYPCSLEANTNTMYFTSNERRVFTVKY